MAFSALLLLFQILSCLFAGGLSNTIQPHPPKTLNLTTIAANSHKESIIQCWQLAAPFKSSSTAGTSGAVFAQLGDATGTSYGVIPPVFDGGLHNAPAVQYVAFTSGKAVISLPISRTSATIHGGKHGLILAVDTKQVSTLGHITKYPSKENTVALQIPTAGNKVPVHKVLYDGPCKECDLTY